MKPKTSRFGKLAAFVALFVALAFTLVGLARSHKVYEGDEVEFGVLSFRRISERALVTDATFGGVEKRKARLYSTYDRSAPAGKRACPT